MTRGLGGRMPGSVGSVIFGVASFFLLWPFARLDFDRHHDGYMLAQAVAVHQGASVHSDVFAQYGPVTPWLQSLALNLPLGPGLALRTLNVAFIAITASLLADMGRRNPRDWPVTRAVGWWAAIAWIVLADVWMAIPMLPWSSTLALMLSVATLYLLARSIHDAEEGRTRSASITALFGGVCLGFMPFTRINVGLSALAVYLSVAALMVFIERGTRRSVAGLFILGTLLSILMVVIILARSSSLGDFYYQAIEWPLKWGRSYIGTSHARESLTYPLRQTLPVALVLFALRLQFRARSEQSGKAVNKSKVDVFTVFVGIIIVFWENLRVPIDGPETTWWKSLASGLLFHASSVNYEYLHFFMVLSIVVAVITCVVSGWRLVSRSTSFVRLTPWLLLGGLTLSALTQSVPTWDPRHLWWAAPIGLLLLFSVVRVTSTLNRLSSNPLMLPLALVTVTAAFSSSAYWGLQRVEGRQGTVIEGMLVSRAEFNQINQDTQFLREHLRGSEAVYLVDDGDLSVLDGQYRSADSYFVEWGGSPPLNTRTHNEGPIVVQADILDEAKIKDFARSVKYEVIAKSPRLAVLRHVSK